VKYLFIDDERMPGDVTWVRSPSASWEIVRSFDEAVKWVKRNGFPDVVSFDHDLGLEHYAHNYSDGKTGFHFAKWLVEHDIDTNSMPAHFSYTVHSKNPVGAENIRGLLNNYIRFKNDRT
jgi:hypothetical protein